jgi:hypothetical protein
MPIRRFRMLSRAVPIGARIDKGQFSISRLNPEVGGLVITGNATGLEAGRVINPGVGSFIITGQAVTLQVAERLKLSGDMSDGDDLLLLSGDMQSGTDHLIISS